MTTSLVERIQCLPKVLQDIIYEYNVEHRIKTRILNNEYMNIMYSHCLFCKKPFPKELFCSTDYFVQKKYDLPHGWCSDYCFHNDENRELVKHYIESFQKYFSEDSILYKGEIIEF